MTPSPRAALAEAVDAMERAYEFFLAYAAQGMRKEAAGTRAEAQVREHLTAMRDAAAGLDELLGRLLESDGEAHGAPLAAFRAVVAQDARAAGAALDLVLHQEVVTSQLVDNLNASLHVRTLLTDLFLLDESVGLTNG